MKIKTVALIAGLFLCSTLFASPSPSKPQRALQPLDTIKAACLYLLGNDYSQNTPLPGYAFEVWTLGTQGAVPHYYNEVSAGRFLVNGSVLHNDNKCYVMADYSTPHNADASGPIINAAIARIDAENDWSFADYAIWYPSFEDTYQPGDTPFVWLYVVFPTSNDWPANPGAGFGSAPCGPWTVATNDYLDGKKVYVNVFGLTRTPSPYRDYITACIVHEFNHQWFPDLGYNPNHYALGGFEPQCAGYGFYDQGYDGPPSPINPKWRNEAGWMERVNLAGQSQFDRIIYDQTRDTVYYFSEFFFSVHRKISHYERLWPGLGGLMIWHSKNSTGLTGFDYGAAGSWDNGDYLNKPLDLEAAHGRWDWDGLTRIAANPVDGRDNLDMKPWDYYEDSSGVGDASCFFWPNDSTIQFDGLTNPSSRGYTRNSSYEVVGDGKPQEVAMRRLTISGAAAMKADFLYKYCIPSNYPGIAIHSGANNQRSLVPSIYWYGAGGQLYQTYAIAYVDNDPMLWVRIGGFSGLPDASRQLVYQGDSASYPCLYSHGQNTNQLAICWLDGTSLYYRHGTKPQQDTVTWNTSAFDLSTLGDWPGFTAPAMVVGAGDTVFVATGVSLPYLPVGQGPTYFPVLCFRFYKWSPQNAVVDTLALHLVDTVAGVEGKGASVALELDDNNRVHAVYQINSGTVTRCGYRYYDGSWNAQTEMFSSSYYSMGAPCLEFYPVGGIDYLHYVVACLNPSHPASKQVYYSRLDVTGSVGSWTTPSRISTASVGCYDPIIAGANHIFWGQGGELIYRYWESSGSLPEQVISNTPHAWSSAPQAVYDYGDGGGTAACHFAWRENNDLGSEIDLRTFLWEYEPYEGGGQSGARLKSGNIELELSDVVCSGDGFGIRYSLPSYNSQADLKIYDCQGRVIRRWVLTDPEGHVEWDRRDESNRIAGSGVYFVRVEVGNQYQCSKFIMIK